MCDHGLVPTFHGYFDRIDPSAFKPPLEHFVHDKYQPSAILLEFLPNAEKLDCENYSEDLFRYAVDGIKKIHGAFVHHHDIYPRNMLVVSGNRIVWTDFDVSTTFSSMGPREKAYCQYETELVKSFGRKLVCPTSVLSKSVANMYNYRKTIRDRVFHETQSIIDLKALSNGLARYWIMRGVL